VSTLTAAAQRRTIPPVIVTIPLGTKRRVTVALTPRVRLSAVTWRKDFRIDPPDEPEGGAGVREPRRPIPPAGSGSLAVPL
jgi:hypothetical protein